MHGLSDKGWGFGEGLGALNQNSSRYRLSPYSDASVHPVCYSVIESWTKVSQESSWNVAVGAIFRYTTEVV